jgi:hypothetical protein
MTSTGVSRRPAQPASPTAGQTREGTALCGPLSLAQRGELYTLFELLLGYLERFNPALVNRSRC